MDRKVLYINSRVENYTSGSNEDFTIVKIGEEFTSTPKSVKVLNASIPYSWNNVNMSSFTIEENGTPPIVITLTPGNYNGITLAAEIELQLVGITAQAYTVTFTDSTNLLTFTTVGPNGFNITIVDAPTADLLGLAIGTTPAGFALSIVSAPIKLLLDYEIFLCADLVGGSDNGIIPWNVQPLSNHLNQNQILAAITVDKCFNSVLTYCAPNDMPYFPVVQSTFSGDNEFKPVRFFLKFPSGAVVDLNGYHWTATLVFDFND